MAAKTASLSVNIIADAAKAKAGLREAETAFGKFRNSVGQADGAMGKFKASSGAAFDFVKSNAMNFSTAAGAAIVAFGVKSVKAFQDLALGVSKFSDATGMTLDSASRFIEVAGDIGIEAGTLEKSLNFMNKTMGNSPQLFKELGIQIEYTSGGAKDMSATFLNVIDRINGISDPAEKAALASKLLGRGWAEMAELIAMGSGSLKKSLSEVNDAQIVTPEKVKQAKALRDEMDILTDSAGNFAKSLGEELTPALTDVIRGINKMVETSKDIAAFEVFGVSVGSIAEGLFKFSTAGFQGARALWGWIAGSDEAASSASTLTVVTDEMTTVWKEGYRAMIDAVPPARNLTSEIERQKEVLDRARGAWDLFKNGLNIRAERLALDGDIEAFRKKWESSTEDAKANSREYQEELLRLQVRVAGLATEVATTASAASRNLIKILIDTGELERALRYIEMLKAGYEEARRLSYQSMQPTQPAGPAPAPAPRPSAPAPPSMTPPRLTPRQADLLGKFKGLASGGTLTSSGLVMVGEDGPELLGLPRGASVTPNIPQRLNDAAGGTTIVVNVQAGLVSSPDQVGQQIIEAIRRAERRSGQVFASV